MAAMKGQGTVGVNGFEGECKPLVELVHSLQQQANTFFTGRQTMSSPCHSRQDAQANLDELSKLTDTMYEKLQATGLHALPLDSEMLQLDCQATIKKSQEDVENSRATVQRVQINSVTLNKVMGLAPKK